MLIKFYAQDHCTNLLKVKAACPTVYDLILEPLKIWIPTALTKKLSRHTSQSGCSGEEKSTVPLPGIKLRIVQLVAQSLIPNAILAFEAVLFLSMPRTKFLRLAVMPIVYVMHIDTLSVFYIWKLEKLPWSGNFFLCTIIGVMWIL
jgi:hypothetical protein